jgi:hypothetical protein
MLILKNEYLTLIYMFITIGNISLQIYEPHFLIVFVRPVLVD